MATKIKKSLTLGASPFFSHEVFYCSEKDGPVMWESDTFALDMDLPVDVDEGKTKKQKLCIGIGNTMLLYGIN